MKDLKAEHCHPERQRRIWSITPALGPGLPFQILHFVQNDNVTSRQCYVRKESILSGKTVVHSDGQCFGREERVSSGRHSMSKGAERSDTQRHSTDREHPVFVIH